jgi:ferric-dicitrate binding protein FerR (iron transport regulator)
MTPDPREVLSALLDREAVDPDALAIVLEDAAHRRLLIDFVRLRAALSEPAEDAAPVRPLPLARRPWRTAAAALILAGMSATAGAWFAAGSGREEQPPEPTRIVKLAPVEAVR